jgi:hypothetical protein
MLQSMLFFGLWESVIGIAMSSREFLMEYNGVSILSSGNLRSLIQETTNSINSSDFTSSGDLATVKSISEQVCKVMDEVGLWESALLANHPREYSPMISNLQRQTTLAIEALNFFHRQIPADLEASLEGFHHLNVNECLYRDLLRERGLCPSYHDYLDYVGVSAFEYFCATNPIQKLGLKHSSCSTSICLQSKADEEHNKPNHLPLDCACRSISVLSKRAEEVLKSQSYFVVDIRRLLKSMASPSDAVVSYRPGLAYVAFSHVWSHGLGNVADEGLPICRLRYLEKIIRSLGGKFGRITHFWMDAMCIPDNSELKGKSIALMDQIYSNATVVMALDSMLQTLSLEDLSYESLTLHILLSDWNRRLWTFQEAKLAKNLTIALNGGWISIRALYDALWDMINDGHGSPVTLSCADQLVCLTEHTTGLFEWLPLLQFRSCSVSTDEPLVISVLTGLDIRSLVYEDGEGRMAKFWALLGRVPSGLLFHASPKLKIENYKWAPRSLICGSTETGVAGSRDLDSEVTLEGLKASYFTVDFRDDPMQLDSTGTFVIAIQGVRLICQNRDEDKTWGTTQESHFDALAFARDPIMHRKILKNTLLSAVALKWISSTPETTRYSFKFPLLAEVEESHSLDLPNRAPSRNEVIIS